MITEGKNEERGRRGGGLGRMGKTGEKVLPSSPVSFSGIRLMSHQLLYVKYITQRYIGTSMSKSIQRKIAFLVFSKANLRFSGLLGLRNS